MAIEDWLPFGEDEYGDPDDEVVCNRCGEEGLHWQDCGLSFNLLTAEGELHVCHPPSADDFEDIS